MKKNVQVSVAIEVLHDELVAITEYIKLRASLVHSHIIKLYGMVVSEQLMLVGECLCGMAVNVGSVQDSHTSSLHLSFMAICLFQSQ